MEEVKKVELKEKLWNPNFLLLWQGQLVSCLGDVVYEVALGFWILAVTGSPALMGTLMAATILPRVLVSPFAGVIVDRSDRKSLLIAMDVIRGALIVFVGIAAFMGFVEVWMVFAAGVVMGICGAFFSPAVSSALPDIVPKSKLMQANSVYGMINAGSNIVGNGAGGLIYQLIGAPAMFLFNGLSYLFSSFSLFFVKIPRIESKTQRQDFFDDMKQGFKFIWKFTGLRNLISIAVFLNFFANMGIVLFLPLFQRTESLGPTRYGIAMAFMTGGMLLGMLLTSALKIPPVKRFGIFAASALLSMICWAAFPLLDNFIIMVILLLVAGVLNAIVNVFIQSTMQQTVPQEMRGKVFSLMNALLSGLTPLAMALGGILAEFFEIRYIIFSCFSLTILIMIPFAFMNSFKRFINFDPEKQALSDII